MRKLMLVFMLACVCIFCNNEGSEEGYLHIQGADIYYKVIGAGKPIVVIHGGPMLDHSYFLPHLESLAGDYQLIFYDQRLAGRSSPTSDPEYISIDGFVEDIEGIRQALGLDRFSILGHSWGGMLAFNYALKYPGNVEALLLVNSASASSDLRRREDSTLAARNSPEYLEQRNAIIQSDGFRQGENYAYERLIHLAYRNQFVDTSMARDLNIHLPEDFVERSELFNHMRTDLRQYNFFSDLQRLECPALVFYGDYDVPSQISGPEFVNHLPNAELVIAEDCGHFPFIECPQALSSAIKRILH
jgi:proline iminopeptidase